MWPAQAYPSPGTCASACWTSRCTRCRCWPRGTPSTLAQVRRPSLVPPARPGRCRSARRLPCAEETTFTIGEVLCKPGSALQCALPARLSPGRLILSATEDLGPEARISFRLQARLPQQRGAPTLLIKLDDASLQWAAAGLWRGAAARHL